MDFKQQKIYNLYHMRFYPQNMFFEYGRSNDAHPSAKVRIRMVKQCERNVCPEDFQEDDVKCRIAYEAKRLLNELIKELEPLAMTECGVSGPDDFVNVDFNTDIGTLLQQAAYKLQEFVCHIKHLI